MDSGKAAKAPVACRPLPHRNLTIHDAARAAKSTNPPSATLGLVEDLDPGAKSPTRSTRIASAITY
jgi:hypothetical protein